MMSAKNPRCRPTWISCPAPNLPLAVDEYRVCIFKKRRLFEKRSVYGVKTSVFGVVILQPLSCHFWMWSTLGLHSIYSSASELPL